VFSRRRVVQIFARGARILDGSYMTQELSFVVHNSDSTSNSEPSTVSSVSIADPYVLLKMTDGSIQLLVGGIIYLCFLILVYFFLKRLFSAFLVCYWHFIHMAQILVQLYLFDVFFIASSDCLLVFLLF